MLNAVGVKTNIVVWDFNKDWIDAGKGGRQGYFPKDFVPIINAAPYSDADEYLFSYFHSDSTTNQEHLKDPKLDGMIDKQRTLVNPDERLKAVLDIQRYLADQMYMVPTVGSYKWALFSRVFAITSSAALSVSLRRPIQSSGSRAKPVSTA